MDSEKILYKFTELSQESKVEKLIAIIEQSKLYTIDPLIADILSKLKEHPHQLTEYFLVSAYEDILRFGEQVKSVLDAKNDDHARD